jgi:signal transduction histidine kinase
MTYASIPPVTFLLVDDRPENLVALEALLRRDGLQLLKAHSGGEALELLLLHDIGLAIIDVRMPDMDGFELAELMRGKERSRSIPIIFVTASSSDAQPIFDGYDAGAVDFLFKPIDPRILRNKVETFLQLCRQRQELTETLRFHETFVAAIGHDLRNPLNAIVMAARLLAASNSDAATSKLVTRLLSSSQRMSFMVDQLFDLSRSRLGGGIPLDRRTGDLVPALEGVVAEQCSATSSQIELSATGDATGSWDVPRLMQAVANLLSNAARHGNAGSPIRVTLTVDADEVALAVHNQGFIPEETTVHLFEPFVSRPAQRSSKEGLGLGLYIVDQIVRGHGGRVEVQSSREDGTTFTIRLPREPLSNGSAETRPR